MKHQLLKIESTDQMPETYLREIGSLFAVFDEHSQDSGNISYGVQVDRQRFFVKTAGDPSDLRPFLSHKERVSLLHNAVRLRRSCAHSALPQLHNVIESLHGPMLVYDWIEGELLHADSATRQQPQSALQRFRRLPVPEILSALHHVFELHLELVQAGWIAVDFYDGCLIYDFATRKMQVIDLDMYREGPFVNGMGRMFGSSRFMAPEEFERGAIIDEKTTVFTMGRTVANLLSDGSLARSAFRGGDGHYSILRRACCASRDQRFASISEFYAAWLEAGMGALSV